MSYKFSGPVTITDLDDYIIPSQECIKPVEISKINDKKANKIEYELTDKFLSKIDNKEKRKELSKVEINLSDCLACSGCVTSAETLLINNQSLQEVYNVLKEVKRRKFLVIVLSPQSTASLATKYNLGYKETSCKLVTFFRNMGFEVVMDTSIGRELSLLETNEEFIKRYRNHSYIKSNNQETPFAFLTSNCPGWVCYAEKTQPQSLLNLLSPIKSPQQITASFLKYHISNHLKVPLKNIYLICVAPCFDKKLEATRFNFNPNTQSLGDNCDGKMEGRLALEEIREVDCVLSTLEVEEMLQKEAIDLQSLKGSKSFHCEGLDNYFEFVRPMAESDGYLGYVMNQTSMNFFDTGGLNKSIKFFKRKNSDFIEVFLENKKNETKEEIIKFALVQGFKNLQNLVQKIKKKKSHYVMVQLMACPSGCLNGGGQLKHSSDISDCDSFLNRNKNKTSLEKIRNIFDEIVDKKRDEFPLAQFLRDKWIKEIGKSEYEKVIFESFKTVPKISSALFTKCFNYTLDCSNQKFC